MISFCVEGNCGPGRKQWQATARSIIVIVWSSHKWTGTHSGMSVIWYLDLVEPHRISAFGVVRPFVRPCLHSPWWSLFKVLACMQFYRIYNFGTVEDRGKLVRFRDQKVRGRGHRMLMICSWEHLGCTGRQNTSSEQLVTKYGRQ